MEPDSKPAEPPKAMPAKGLAPLKAIKRARSGGTIRRLAQARANMSPAGRRNLNVAVIVSLVFILGVVGTFLGVVRPWEPNDPAPSRTAQESGAEAMRVWTLEWTKDQELRAAELLLEYQHGEAVGEIADGPDALIKHARNLVKAQGVTKALVQPTVVAVDEKIIFALNDRTPGPARDHWCTLLSASNLQLSLESMKDTEERYSRNQGPLIEDLWVGALSRAKNPTQTQSATQAQIGGVFGLFGMTAEYELYHALLIGRKFESEEWERRLEASRQANEYRITEDGGD